MVRCDSNQQSVDFEDAVVGSMALSMGKFGSLIGDTDVRIGELFVSLGSLPSDPIERLNVLIDFSFKIEKETGVQNLIVLQEVLKYDGWSWNSHVLRSPPYYSAYFEIDIQQAMTIKGMEWLEKFSSETK